MKGDDGGFDAPHQLEQAIMAKREGDNRCRYYPIIYGAVLRADFGNVNIHTDSESDGFNQSLDARAFTLGSDVFFRQGEYEPDSDQGKELLAHELTHVVQQGG